MSSAVAVKSEEKKSKAAASQQSVPDPMQLQYSSGASAGLPRFLQPGPRIQVQAKCAKCQEEEEEPFALQSKCSCGGDGSCGCDHKTGGIHSAAREGVEGAHQRLPHLDRIQASFGRHDVSGARASIAGSAAVANQRMGSLAYTAGNRIAFGREPDVKLAAHEAAHVVQQRNGAKLPGGVGRPGDEYEQQADAAAEAVDRGESAEPILDHASPSRPGGVAAAVQHRLDVNASRIFEPPMSGSEVMAGTDTAGGKGAASSTAVAKSDKTDSKVDEEDKAQDKEEGGKQNGGAVKKAPAPNAQQAGGQAPGAQAQQPGVTSGSGSTTTPAPGSQPPQAGAAPQADQGANPPGATPSPAAGAAAPPTPGAPAPATSAAPPAVSCTPECFRAPKEEPEDKSSDEKPADPPAGKSEEQVQEGDTPDAPEPDDCKMQQAQATGGPASGTATANPAPAAAAGGSASPGAAAGPAPTGPAQPGKSTGKAAAGGGAAKAETGGGGGQSLAAGKVKQGLSPVDASIAQSLAQRSAAVQSYEASSGSLAAVSARSAELRSGIRFAPNTSGGDQQAQRDASSALADQFFSNAADGLDQAIAFATNDVPDLLGAQAESGKARILTAAEAQKAAVSSRISASRSEARADASIARRAVVQQADSIVEQVQTGSAAAIAALVAAHAATNGQVEALQTTTLDQVNQIYANGRTEMEGLGTTIGNECTAIGEQFAGQYEGFANCTENGFWDGDLSERRAAAQAEAARKTAKGYHDSTVDSAKKRAREVVKDGRKKNRCQVITMTVAIHQKLDETLTQLTASIEDARDHAIEQANSTRTALLAGIDASLGGTLQQLDQQEFDLRQTVDDTCYLQQVLQEQMAHSAAAALQELVSRGASTLHSSLVTFRSQFAASQAPDPKVLDEALAIVSQNVDAALGGMQTGLAGGTASSTQQLGFALSTGVAALGKLIAANEETASAITGGFGSSMGAIAGQDNFAALRAGFSQMMQQVTSGGSDAFQKIFGAMSDGCGKITADSQKSLKQAAGDLEKSLRQSKQGIECQITKEADEAASHEAPAWKRLIAILLIIVVIIIVIAVTVLTAGAGLGLLAVIALGAVVGAVTSGLIAMATNLWTNQAVMKGVGKAVLIGAVTGAAGGAIGMGVGALVGKAAGALGSLASVTISKAAVEVASTMISTAVIDVGSQFIEGGFSFKNFSLKQLGGDLALALVMHGVGKLAEPHAVVVGAPEGGPHPTEPALAEPTPAEHAPAEPTPVEPAPAEPTPAEAKPSEPTPSEPAPAEPAPAEAAPKEPVPTEPAPARSAPAEPAPAEPAAAEPVAPEEAKPAEAGEAPTTPEEKQVLDQTANKNSDELTPEEALTERDVASRTKGEPIEDPPFTTRKELPNGHEMEETPTGDECKRCSDACAVFDAQGRRLGTVSAGPEGIVEHPVSTPEVEHVPPGRGPSAEPEFSASPEVSEPAATPREPTEQEIRAHEDLVESIAKDTTPTHEMNQAESEARAHGVDEHANRRISESTSEPERVRAAEEAEPVPQPEDLRGNEPEIGSTVPEEIPEGGLFEPEVSEPADQNYELLRRGSPSPEIREKFNPPGEKFDPVYGHKVDSLSADHIVSLKEITQMPGFDELSLADQLAVANFEDNFMGMDPDVNSSKGARTYDGTGAGIWEGHPEFGPVPPEFRAKMALREAELRIQLQAEIDARLSR
jgi:vacuolar-type H+-ATPase subunit H